MIAARPHRQHRHDALGLALWLTLGVAVVALNGLLTRTSVDGWYQSLAKPSFNPPDWAFAPAWVTLFALMSVAAWRVWRTRHPWRRRALALFALQLALNPSWSALFFGLRWPLGALVEIVALWLAILATVRAFIEVERSAGLLLLPYLAWVSFAAVLNAGIVTLN